MPTLILFLIIGPVLGYYIQRKDGLPRKSGSIWYLIEFEIWYYLIPSLWPQFPKQEIFLTFPSIQIFGAECCANIIQGAFFDCSAQKTTKYREKLKYQNCSANSSSKKILSTRKKQSIRIETRAHVYSCLRANSGYFDLRARSNSPEHWAKKAPINLDNRR